MNIISFIASFLHIALLVIVYIILPKLAPPDKEEDIKHWILTSFSSIFLILIMASSYEKVNVFVLLFIGVVVISGIAWWVPSYIPKDDQYLVSNILIVISSAFITIISTLFSLEDTETLGLHQASILEKFMGGKRKLR